MIGGQIIWHKKRFFPSFITLTMLWLVGKIFDLKTHTFLNFLPASKLCLVSKFVILNAIVMFFFVGGWQLWKHPSPVHTVQTIEVSLPFFMAYTFNAQWLFSSFIARINAMIVGQMIWYWKRFFSSFKNAHYSYDWLPNYLILEGILSFIFCVSNAMIGGQIIWYKKRLFPSFIALTMLWLVAKIFDIRSDSLIYFLRWQCYDWWAKYLILKPILFLISCAHQTYVWCPNYLIIRNDCFLNLLCECRLWLVAKIFDLKTHTFLNFLRASNLCLVSKLFDIRNDCFLNLLCACRLWLVAKIFDIRSDSLLYFLR